MRRLFLVLLLLAAPGAASAQSVERYYVSGKTLQALHKSIRQLGPQNATGTTQNRWKYSYSRVRSKGYTWAINPKVTREIVFRMPFWSGYHSASKCVQRSWDAMYASLARHEIKHAELGNNVAAEVEKAILSVRRQTTNAGLERAVTEAVNRVFQANGKVQDKFDRDTKHGTKDPHDPIVFKTCP